MLWQTPASEQTVMDPERELMRRDGKFIIQQGARRESGTRQHHHNETEWALQIHAQLKTDLRVAGPKATITARGVASDNSWMHIEPDSGAV